MNLYILVKFVTNLLKHRHCSRDILSYTLVASHIVVHSATIHPIARAI